MNGDPEESGDLCVFVDCNLLISVLISCTSGASQFLTLVLHAHRLVLWDYGLTDMA